MNKTEGLLHKWVETAPKRLMDTARLLREAGLTKAEIEEELKIKLAKPEAGAHNLPTFDPKVTRPISPMLLARFRFAGAIYDSGEKWLDVKDMRKAVTNAKVLKHFNSRKEYWENSAPSRFATSQLSLFAIEPGAEENQTYLVWPSEKTIEPEIHRYVDHSEHIFKDLNAFLKWASGG
jgi:hypothetical protein